MRRESVLAVGLSVGLGRCETCGVLGAHYYPPIPDTPLLGIWMCDSCVHPDVVRVRMKIERARYRITRYGNA